MDKHKQGRINRRAGADFERRTRDYLERTGWFVGKFQNNVDLEKNVMIPAKASRFRIQSTGFPDFFCWTEYPPNKKMFEIMGVECKVNGKLSKEEKEKCRFLLKKGIFSRILVAKKIKEGRKVSIDFVDFEERYNENKRKN